MAYEAVIGDMIGLAEIGITANMTERIINGRRRRRKRR